MSSRKRKLSSFALNSKMGRSLYKKVKRSPVPFKRSRYLGIGVPPELECKLVYHDSYTHTHTTGAMQLWELRANSVYDPDYTYTGHQPTQFDELAALYQRYYVSAAKIEVNASPISSSGSNVPIVVAILPRLEQNTMTDINTVCENPASVHMVVSGSTSDANVNKTISKYVNIKKLFGVKDLYDLDYSAAVTTSPNQVAFLSIYSNSANGGSTSIVGLTTTITFWCKFYKRQTTVSS